MKRFLLIDDDSQLPTMFGVALRKEGCHVIEAASGVTGLAAARKHLPHLILSDINKGAERLNLPNDVTKAHFTKLSSGYDPITGNRLMVRDKGTKGRICYFGQFSPPKDASIAYFVGGDTAGLAAA